MSDYNFEVFTGQQQKRNFYSAHLLKTGILTIHKKWIDSGFDVNARYAMLFSKEYQTIGLKVSNETYAVKVQHNKSNDQHVISLKPFCYFYDIPKGIRFTDIQRDENGVWLLPLNE